MRGRKLERPFKKQSSGLFLGRSADETFPQNVNPTSEKEVL
jgi:hypothetical protein